ncbi:MAG TPA: hypothetical protein VF766_00465 [Pyrinomonadaceae bacterium]
MSWSNTNYIIRLFVLLALMVFVGADLSVSAQNSNSSTMSGDASMQQNSNTNMKMPRAGRRRRGRSNREGRMNDAMPSSDTASEPGQVFVTDRPVNMTAQTGRCDPNAQEQTDLSGTYTGTVNYPEGGLSGDTTLTINGNKFTMTSGSTTQEGRVVAVTTCNYTAVTMMFGQEQVTATSGPQPAPLPVVSLRARKVGSGLTLESVGGESRQFSFSPAATRNGGAMPKRGRAMKRTGAPNPVGIKPPTR